jgi:hypothetical protein
MPNTFFGLHRIQKTYIRRIMTEPNNQTAQPNLELIIDEVKWDVIIGMKPGLNSSEHSWLPDPSNNRLYVGKALIADLDNIKHSCWSMYHNGEVRNFHYF